MSARIIAIAVPKGGTGKTTTTANLGAALAERGKRVCLIDFDPQGSLTLMLNVQASELPYTMYTVIEHYISTYESNIEKAIVKTSSGLDLVPANIMLNLADASLKVADRGEGILQVLLEPIAQKYDYILIDTLPYFGILVTNALVAAHEVLIPCETGYLATESVGLILARIISARKGRLNSNLKVTGILLTKARNTGISRDIVNFVQTKFGEGEQVPVYGPIKLLSSFEEASASNQTILQYAPKSEGATAYRDLAEVIDRGQA